MDPPAGVTSFLYPFCVTLRVSRRVPELSILFWIPPAGLECFSENPFHGDKIIKNSSLILRFEMTAILKKTKIDSSLCSESLYGNLDSEQFVKNLYDNFP